VTCDESGKSADVSKQLAEAGRKSFVCHRPPAAARLRDQEAKSRSLRRWPLGKRERENRRTEGGINVGKTRFATVCGSAEGKLRDVGRNVDSRNSLRLALRVPHPRDLPRALARSGFATAEAQRRQTTRRVERSGQINTDKHGFIFSRLTSAKNRAPLKISNPVCGGWCRGLLFAP
jgi:hypothetical protein